MKHARAIANIKLECLKIQLLLTCFLLSLSLSCMSGPEGKPYHIESGFEPVKVTALTEEDVESSTDDPIGHHIGLFGTVTLILGRVVGSGIFASPGPLYANVNSVGMALIL